MNNHQPSTSTATNTAMNTATNTATQGARFPFGKRPPSRGMTIFLVTVSAFVGIVYRDRYKSKQIRERLIAKVSHLAEEPLGSDEMPRKVTVYLTAPPGDSIEKSRIWFREYVKPIFVAAALDYDLKEGRENGKVQSLICEEIQKRRKAAADGVDLDNAPLQVPGSQVVIKQNATNGIVALGRIAWREILNGLNDGCIASLKDKVMQTAPDADSSASAAKDTPSSTSILPTEPAEQQPAAEFSLPLHFHPIGYIPQQNLLGWPRLLDRIYLWANDYQRVERIGECAVQIALGATRDFEKKDEEMGINEREDWVKEFGAAQLLRDNIVLDERIANTLKVIV